VDDALEVWRQSHPLASVMPVIRRLLVEDASDAGLLVAVSDAAGRKLWVEGHNGLRTRAEQMHFVAGALWSEDRAGTNAPGTALGLRSHDTDHLQRTRQRDRHITFRVHGVPFQCKRDRVTRARSSVVTKFLRQGHANNRVVSATSNYCRGGSGRAP
jgi:transcriptional regulator of acetoin/glycerol metabolism